MLPGRAETRFSPILRRLLAFCRLQSIMIVLQEYPVYGPYVDDDGTEVPGDIEFEFALAAINTARAQCKDPTNFPPVTSARPPLQPSASSGLIRGVQIGHTRVPHYY
jgi:hypothetical protein